MGLFQKAVKHDAKLRLAIAGPSGSGKTYSALAIATALGGPIAFVDTEHGSASKYADIFNFDVAEMHAPYHPDKFIEAIRSASEAGYKVIILDSMTHAWNGEGGLLELVEQATKRQKTANTYTAWHDVTPIQNRLIEAIVTANIHIIATMRSKQEYVQEKDNNGKSTIRKVGMAPIQRDGFEYEFDVFFDMDVDNNAVVSKTRCSALTGKVIAKPGAQVAKILKDWLGGAPVQDAPQPSQKAQDATEDRLAALQQERMAIEMSDLEHNHRKRELAPIDAEIAKLEQGPTYAHLIDKLTGDCLERANRARKIHAQSKGPASPEQYRFLAGTIDDLVRQMGGHKAILEVFVGRAVSSANPPGIQLAGKLLDALLEERTVEQDGEKVKEANPDYNPEAVACIHGIWALVRKQDGQDSLFDVAQAQEPASA